jgi:hypothetical protein
VTKVSEDATLVAKYVSNVKTTRQEQKATTKGKKNLNYDREK